MEVKPGYKQTDAGVIPEDWDAPLLGDLFKFKNGLNKGKEFFGYGTPIVNYMDVYAKSGLHPCEIYGRVDVNKSELKAFEVRKGDVFFTRTSETIDEVGMSSVMLGSPVDTVFSGFVLRARQMDLGLTDQYKKYCFSTFSIRSQITSKSTYTTRALINGRVLSSLSIAMPSLPEQFAIATALSDVDALLAKLDALIAKKRDLKVAAMQQLLNGQTRLPGFGGDWEVKRLGDIAEIRKGQLITEKDAIFGDVPVIAGGKKPSYFHNEPNRIGKTITVSASGASAGYVAFFDTPIFASDCSTIGDSKAYSIEFIYFQLMLQQDVIYRAQTGGAQPHIHAVDLMPLKIGACSLEEQTAIATVLSDMDTELTALEARRDKTRALKQGMMQELLTGRIRLL